jgi:hypothetical protein
MSRRSQGGKRFAGENWIKEFVSLNLPYTAGHLCGEYVKEFLNGNLSFINKNEEFWHAIQRIQINTHGELHQFEGEKLEKGIISLPSNITEIIFQIDNINDHIRIHAEKFTNPSISGLHDLSHGAGISPEKWLKKEIAFQRGYAGGLGPDNIVSELEKIEEAVGDARIWIDMETNIRSNKDKQFDLEKVEFCLKAAEKYV